MPPLSILVWLPAASGLLGALLSLRVARLRSRTALAAPAATLPGWWLAGAPAAQEAAERETAAHRRPVRAPALIALAGSLAALGLSIGYIADFSSSARGLQHVTDVSWIGELGIHYRLGLSGLNVFLVALTALLFAAATLAASLRSWERPRLFYFHFMLAESAVLGAFL